MNQSKIENQKPKINLAHHRDIYYGIGVSLIITIMYIPTIYKLFDHAWRASDYDHGPLMFLIFLWLVWRSRDFLNLPVDRSFHPFYLLLFILGLLLYLLGTMQRFIIIETFSMIPVILGTTGFLLGRDSLKGILFPILFIAFLIPLPLFFIDMLTTPLKEMVSYVTSGILRLTHYPVSRNGVIINIADYSLLVSDACSGLRSIISIMAVSSVFLYIQKITLIHKLLIFIFVLPITLFANILRILLLALITYYYGEAAGQGFFHNFSGYLLFAVSLISLAVITEIAKGLRKNKLP